MGLWRSVEQALFTGKITQEYGSLAVRRRFGMKETVSALLANRHGVDRFVIKVTHSAFLTGDVAYLDFDRDAAVKLKAALDHSLERMT